MFEQPITRRLNGVIFGFYTSDEIRKISVKEISNPVAFDQLNRPLVGGLYDPIMGVSPYDKFTKCETCGQEGINCTGHMAHVELLLPVYNPFLMDRLIKLLKYKCFACHKLRIPQKKIDDFCNMLMLLKLGYITECHEYEKTIENRYLKEHQKSQNNDVMNDLLNETATDTTRSRANSGSSKAKDSKSQSSALNVINKTVEVQKAQEKIEKYLDLLNVKKHKSHYTNGINIDNAINTALRYIYIKEIYRF